MANFEPVGDHWKMIIALDYDNCYILDREFWKTVIRLAKARGHQVICCSGRDDNEANRKECSEAYPPGTPIVLCNHKLKRAEALRQGYPCNIWIDDTPEGIGPSNPAS